MKNLVQCYETPDGFDRYIWEVEEYNSEGETKWVHDIHWEGKEDEPDFYGNDGNLAREFWYKTGPLGAWWRMYYAWTMTNEHLNELVDLGVISDDTRNEIMRPYDLMMKTIEATCGNKYGNGAWARHFKEEMMNL